MLFKISIENIIGFYVMKMVIICSNFNYLLWENVTFEKISQVSNILENYFKLNKEKNIKFIGTNTNTI